MSQRRRERALGAALLAALSGFALCGQVAAPAQPPAAALASTKVLGGAFDYRVVSGDSLARVAARTGVSVEALARASGLDPNARLAVGVTLRVENPHIVPPVTADAPRDGILINVPQRMLFQLRGGEAVAGYPIAAGRPTWRTPIGEFEIDARATDKPWIVPPSIQEEMRREGKPVKTIVPPGPENPLGRHWLGLSRSSCGIHGTIAPASLYALRTHGCIRLHPDDVAALYETTPLGEPVRIVYEPVLVAAQGGGRVCVEAHPDAYGLGGAPVDTLERVAATSDLAERIDWSRARDVIAALEGIASDVTLGGPGGPCL